MTIGEEYYDEIITVSVEKSATYRDVIHRANQEVDKRIQSWAGKASQQEKRGERLGWTWTELIDTQAIGGSIVLRYGVLYGTAGVPHDKEKED